MSGGKDSLCVFLWAMDNLVKYNITFHLFMVKTVLDYYGIPEYLNYIVAKYNQKILIEQHTQEEEKKLIDKLYKKAEAQGIPFPFPYCEGILKQPIYKKWRISDISLDGCRWAESSNRSTYTPYSYNKGKFRYRPILTWKHEEVYKYISKHNLPLFWVYQYENRLSCALCMKFLKKTSHLNNILMPIKFKDKYNFNFFNGWMSAIEKFSRECKSEWALKNKQFTDNYFYNINFIRGNSSKIILTKRNNPFNLKFYTKDGII
jgi:3'-phosphoadenosine 5'-phosphosulfate sulfotransferase (PAPS reductase)/FAD synthetase